MISAFGVDHGGISKAVDQKKRDKQGALGVGAGAAAFELGHGAKRGVKGVNQAITAHESGYHVSRPSQPASAAKEAAKAVRPLAGKQKAALRTGAAIGGGLARSPHAAAIGAVGGGGFYGIQRMAHKKKES